MWRLDKNALVYFNGVTGGKLRLALGSYTKASKPELVDIKINDYCPFACDFCLGPESLVLMQNGSWKSLEDVKIGDNILAVPESGYCKIIPAVVENKWETFKEAFEVTFSDGRTIVSSANHKFLPARGEWIETSRLTKASRIANIPLINPEFTEDYKIGYLSGMTWGDGTIREELKIDGKRVKQAYWRVAISDIDALDRLQGYMHDLNYKILPHRPFTNNSEIDNEWKDLRALETRSAEQVSAIKSSIALAVMNNSEKRRGFVAGFFDAEGAFYKGSYVRMYQKDYLEAFDLVCQVLTEQGFRFSTTINKEGCHSLTINGNGSTLKFVQHFQPGIERKRTFLVNKKMHRKQTKVKVVSVKSLGVQRLIDITTSSRTFIANGFVTHNCYQGSTASGGHSSIEQMTFIMNELSKIRVMEVALGGGEPTMHPAFLDIVNGFRDRNIVPNFTTKNLGYVKRNWSKLAGVVGAFAYSADDAKHVHLAAKMLNDVPKDRVNLHYVMGLGSQEHFIEFMIAAKTHNFRVTLLGYKTVGRGSEVEHVSYDWWMHSLQMLMSRNMCPTISIDTPMAEQYAESLLMPRRYFHTREGAFSMYVDAPAMLMGASSFDGTETLQPFDNTWRQRYATL